MCVRACVRQYSNRREFDLHVGVLELTQARLHWDKSSGLTGILKRSELSLTQTHTHTHKDAHTAKVHMHVSTYPGANTHTHTHTHTYTPFLTPTHTSRGRAHAKTVNHVKLKEKSVRSLPISFREWLRHTHTPARKHTLWAAAKNPWSWQFFAWSYFSPSFHTHTHTHTHTQKHTHTHTQDHWCIKLFWSVYGLWLVAVLLAKKKKKARLPSVVTALPHPPQPTQPANLLPDWLIRFLHFSLSLPIPFSEKQLPFTHTRTHTHTHTGIGRHTHWLVQCWHMLAQSNTHTHTHTDLIGTHIIKT